MRSTWAVMRAILRSRVGISLIAGMAGVAVAGGEVRAAIPDATGSIHACYVKGVGLLRVVDSESGEACTPPETGLSWGAASNGPVAYGFIDAGGFVDPARSMGLDAEKSYLGGSAGDEAYCVVATEPVKNVMVTLSHAVQFVVPEVTIGASPGCGTSTSFTVRMRSANGLALEGWFYVLAY